MPKSKCHRAGDYQNNDHRAFKLFEQDFYTAVRLDFAEFIGAVCFAMLFTHLMVQTVPGIDPEPFQHLFGRLGVKRGFLIVFIRNHFLFCFRQPVIQR